MQNLTILISRLFLTNTSNFKMHLLIPMPKILQKRRKNFAKSWATQRLTLMRRFLLLFPQWQITKISNYNERNSNRLTIGWNLRWKERLSRELFISNIARWRLTIKVHIG